MATNSYFRLSIILIFILFNNLVLYSMQNSKVNISLEEAVSLYKKNKLIIIDVRTAKEWSMTGVIPKSILLNMHDDNNQERSNFLNELESQLNINKNKNIAFICASGARSKIITDYLINKGHKNIYHIPDGIIGKNNNGWLYKSYPLINYEDKE